MAINQCECGTWFKETWDTVGQCPDCKEESEKKRLKEIAEIYDIPFKEKL